jgi:hypothetical protein
MNIAYKIFFKNWKLNLNITNLKYKSYVKTFYLYIKKLKAKSISDRKQSKDIEEAHQN